MAANYRLKAARVLLGMTQRALAEKVGTERPHNTLAANVRERVLPSGTGCSQGKAQSHASSASTLFSKIIVRDGSERQRVFTPKCAFFRVDFLSPTKFHEPTPYNCDAQEILRTSTIAIFI